MEFPIRPAGLHVLPKYQKFLLAQTSFLNLRLLPNILHLKVRLSIPRGRLLPSGVNFRFLRNTAVYHHRLHFKMKSTIPRDKEVPKGVNLRSICNTLVYRCLHRLYLKTKLTIPGNMGVGADHEAVPIRCVRWALFFLIHWSTPLNQQLLINHSSGMPCPTPSSKSRKGLPYLWVHMRCCLEFTRECSNIRPADFIISTTVFIGSHF